MASHFVSALNISSLQNSPKNIHRIADNIDGDAGIDNHEDLEDEEDFNVDTNMEVEASGDDDDAIWEASITDFNAGDIIGKLMAFIAQLHSCSEGTQDYLIELATSNGCVAWHIKLWVQTRWGSLSDCFRTVLVIHKVFFPF